MNRTSVYVRLFGRNENCGELTSILQNFCNAQNKTINFVVAEKTMYSCCST